MEYNASQEETKLAVLLSGATTAVLNTVADLKAELKFVYDELKKKNEELKTAESERDNLQKQVDDLVEEVSTLRKQ